MGGGEAFENHLDGDVVRFFTEREAPKLRENPRPKKKTLQNEKNEPT